MADTIEGSFRTQLNVTHTSPLGAGSASMAVSPSYTKNLTFGTGNGQANVVASITGSVTAGVPVDINLQAITSGALPDTLVLLKVVSLVIQDVSTTTLTAANMLKIGDTTGTLTNAWTSPFSTATSCLALPATGVLALHHPAGGYAVDASHKVLRLTAAAGTITYQVDLVGIQ